MHTCKFPESIFHNSNESQHTGKSFSRWNVSVYLLHHRQFCKLHCNSWIWYDIFVIRQYHAFGTELKVLLKKYASKYWNLTFWYTICWQCTKMHGLYWKIMYLYFALSKCNAHHKIGNTRLESSFTQMWDNVTQNIYKGEKNSEEVKYSLP